MVPYVQQQYIIKLVQLNYYSIVNYKRDRKKKKKERNKNFTSYDHFFQPQSKQSFYYL